MEEVRERHISKRKASAQGGSELTRGTRKENTRRMRETILHAAMEEFSAKGYDGARVDEIALRSGINKNVLYHHFGSKDDLFAAVLERTYEVIRSRQKDLQLRNMTAVEGIRKLVVFTGRVWVQFPHFLRLLHSENLLGGRHVKESSKIAKMYNPLLGTIKELLQRGIDEKVFREDVDPIELYISVTSLTAHYISNHHTFDAIFEQQLMLPQRVKRRLEHAADMVERYVLRAPKEIS